MQETCIQKKCRWAVFALARTGSTCHGGSGDFVIAFSTAYTIPEESGEFILKRKVIGNEQILIDQLALAVIEAVEEGIYNSMFMAKTIVGLDGNMRLKLPISDVLEIASKYGDNDRMSA